MRRCTAGRHQFVVNPLGERQVGQPVTVQMTDLAVVDGELDAAEPVRVGLNARPARNLCYDGARDIIHINLCNPRNRRDQVTGHRLQIVFAVSCELRPVTAG